MNGLSGHTGSGALRLLWPAEATSCCCPPQWTLAHLAKPFKAHVKPLLAASWARAAAACLRPPSHPAGTARAPRSLPCPPSAPCSAARAHIDRRAGAWPPWPPGWWPDLQKQGAMHEMWPEPMRPRPIKPTRRAMGTDPDDLQLQPKLA